MLGKVLLSAKPCWLLSWYPRGYVHCRHYHSPHALLYRGHGQQAGNADRHHFVPWLLSSDLTGQGKGTGHPIGVFAYGSPWTDWICKRRVEDPNCYSLGPAVPRVHRDTGPVALIRALSCAAVARWCKLMECTCRSLGLPLLQSIHVL